MTHTNEKKKEKKSLGQPCTNRAMQCPKSCGGEFKKLYAEIHSAMEYSEFGHHNIQDR